ncbi:glycosyl transferase [Alcanivorax sp. N3-2A]|nr:glycosyl transferase [Alcanivorax sp. N3-2A]
MIAPIVLVSNTAWYLYNFRRGTLAELVAQGHRVVTMAPPDRYATKLVEELGVEFVPLQLDGKGTRLLGEALSLLRLFFALRRLRPAFVFNFTVKANIYSGLVCRLLRIPYANNVSGLGTAFIHDSWLYRRVRSLYAFANRGARCVFFQNEEDLQVFNATGLLKGTPTVLLPGSGMDTLRFPFSTLPHEGRFTFVMVARMIADKGVREYVAAAGQVARRHPDARFLLIGPLGVSNSSAIHLDEVARWQSEGVVEYLGEQEDVRPWLAESHVLVLPSYREGMPRTVLEAASMGRPAIVSDVPGCRQAVEKGVTGWLCQVRDADSLAECMETCLTMPRQTLLTAGRAARDRIEAQFDERIVVDAALGLVRG